MFTSQHLQQYISQQQIEAQIIFLAEETPTVASAAAALGTTTDNIGKSVLFWVNNDPWLIIANGLRFIDHKKLADYLGISRRRTKLASAAEVLAITGFAVGTVPPFGHKTALPSLIDENVASLSHLYAGGGDINALVHLTTAELLRVVPAKLVQLTR